VSCPCEDHGPRLVIAIQVLVIVLGSLAVGWSPNFDVVVAIPALVLATCAFASLGSVDGRQLRVEITLAVANAGEPPWV
jgi:hypothetical protein